MNNQQLRGPFLEAAVWNNNAVALLATGKANVAMQGLARGLAILQQQTPNFSFDRSATLDCDSLNATAIPGLKDHDAFYVYNRALLICPSAVACMDIASVLLFNFAMAHHQIAMASPTYLRSKGLQAAQLYSQCNRMLLEGETSLFSKSLHAAAINNFCHLILRLFEAEDEIKTLFDALREPIGRLMGERNGLLGTCADEILLNMLAFESLECIVAPTA